MDARGSLRRHGDRVLALTLVAGVLIQAWLSFGAGGDSIGLRDAVALAVAVLLAASLAWRRRAPLLVLSLAIVAAALTVAEPIDAPLAFVIALTVATYSVGAETTGRAAVVGGIGVGVLVAVAVVKDLGGDSEINDVAVPALILGMPWSLVSRCDPGASVRRRSSACASNRRMPPSPMSGHGSRATCMTRSPIRWA